MVVTPYLSVKLERFSTLQ